METAKAIAVRWNVQTLVIESGVYLLEPLAQYLGRGFRGAWEEGQKLQGLWNAEDVSEFRKHQDPDTCVALWHQELEEQVERDREYFEQYEYFKGGN